MKLKHKLIMDGILLALLMVLMDYSLTGGLLHELLGIGLLAGFIVHVGINRQYYAAMIRGIRSDKVSAAKERIRHHGRYVSVMLAAFCT